MIIDLARRAISEETVKKQLNTRVAISLTSSPLYPGCSEIKKADPNLRYTDGWYFIKYKPTPSALGTQKRYIIMCDIIHWREKFMRVKGWDEVVELAKKEPRVAWLFKYTNISEELFKIARKNICVPIPFSVDIVKYNNEIKEKIKAATGEEPNYGLLVDPLMALAEQERIKAYYAKRNKEIKNL